MFFQQGSRKRRLKLVLDREYETSSAGEDSVPETQRSRLTSTINSHANVNGSVYVAQNGSIIRTRRSAAGPAHSNTNNKLNSPVLSSRLAKHLKKLDKMAATLEERIPLSNPRTEGGCNILRTFQSSRVATSATATSSFTNTDITKTLNVFNTRQSSASLGSTSAGNTGPESGAQGGTEPPASTAAAGRDPPQEGERESKVDIENGESDDGLVVREPLECPSDRTQSDEEELWMGPWNSLHIPMTKL